MKLNKTIIYFAFLASAYEAHAFTLIAPQLKGWLSNDVTVSLNPTNCPANVRPMLESSIALWNSISESNLNLSLGTDSAATVLQANTLMAPEPAVIVCDPNYATTFAGSGSAANSYSITNSQNRIYKGRIILNVDSASTGNIKLYPELTIKVVLAHEMGHVLGLGHSSDSAALMYYSSGYKEEFSLNEDDVNGIAYLYGRNELNGDNLMGGCGAIHASSGSGPQRPRFSNLAALLFLLLLPIAIWKKQRASNIRIG